MNGLVTTTWFCMIAQAAIRPSRKYRRRWISAMLPRRACILIAWARSASVDRSPVWAMRISRSSCSYKVIALLPLLDHVLGVRLRVGVGEPGDLVQLRVEPEDTPGKCTNHDQTDVTRHIRH